MAETEEEASDSRKLTPRYSSSLKQKPDPHQIVTTPAGPLMTTFPTPGGGTFLPHRNEKKQVNHPEHENVTSSESLSLFNKSNCQGHYKD